MVYKNIAIKSDTDNKLMNQCLTEYIKHHPEMKYAKLSRDNMVNIVCDFYLRSN